ncbi:hypothetical protein Zmor_010360 [Zophobas morio]|uniref:Peptidase S1 domain-containing protein n=1 Tax=Zophobas morio TaxID=2755281 RepID=A0AA38IQU6_9CUCU|nr:hypothetical protein Zmor_010360 [Zophobas morio]
MSKKCLEDDLLPTACGRKPTNFSSTKRNVYPWHVSIYNVQKEPACSGSLLSQKLILTIGDCVTYLTGNLIPKEFYTVAVGKNYKEFDDFRDTEAQLSQVDEIFIPTVYDRDGGFANIALLVAKKAFVLSLIVQPVCLDLSQSYKPSENQSLYISSWDVQDHNSTNGSKELVTRFFSRSKCRSCDSTYLRYFLKSDQLCVPCPNDVNLREHEIDNKKYFGVSTKCIYEKGSGVLVEHDDKYYVTGVATSDVASPDLLARCGNADLILYTDISNYITTFILTKFRKLAID